MRRICRILVISLAAALSACGGIKPVDGPGQVAKIKKAEAVVPKQEPLSKYGNPESYVVFGKRYYPLKTSFGFREQGVASWYGKKFHGRKTSSGEIYDMYKMTAAHKHLPLPTFVNVKNLETGKSIVVRVNDRGPFHDNRIIDLSYAAASKLGILNKGTGRVEVSAINPGSQPQIPVRVAQRPTPQEGRAVDNRDTITDLSKDLDEAEIAHTVIANQQSIDTLTVANSSQQGPPVYLQIGSFRERGNAQIALNKVTPHIPGARIQQADSGGIPVYRVQVGPILDAHNADEYVERLFALGFADHHFISP